MPEPSRHIGYLTLLRAAVFVGAAILFAVPLAGNWGIAAAVLAAPAGLLAAPPVAASRYRWPPLAAALLILAVLGLSAGSILGNLPGLAWILGPASTLRVIDAFTFGLLTFAAVLALRTLTLRAPVGAALEAATIVSIVAYAFHLHRQYPFSQPQWLAEWAVSRGYDPRHFIWAIGATTLAGVALLLLPRLRLLPTVAVGLALLAFSGLCLAVFIHWSPAIIAANEGIERQPKAETSRSPSKAASQPQPSPQPEPKPSPEPKPQSEPQPSPQPEPKPSPEPKPQSEPQPSPQPEPKPSPQPQPKPSPQPQPQPKPSPEKKPSPKKQPNPPRPEEEPPDNTFDWGLTGPPALHPVLLMTLQAEYAPFDDSGYYLRVAACSRLAKNRLAPAKRLESDVVWTAPKRPVDLSITVTKGLFTDLPTTVYEIGAAGVPPGLIGPIHFEPDKNPRPDRFTAVFKVASQVLSCADQKGKDAVYSYLLSLSAGSAAWKPEVRRHYLALPNDPRYARLAAEIAETLTPEQRRSPLCRALAIRRWMQSNLTYDYNPRHKNGPDPVASFLFGDRTGYCVHLAHAMAYLLRAQGIPARVATGYCVPRARCGRSSALMAYNVDAHAWAEIYLEGAGWVLVESATKGRIPPPDPEPDPHETDYYLSLLGGPPVAGDAADLRHVARVLLLVLAGGLALALGMVYAVKVYRRLAVRFVPAERLHRVGYRTALDCLAEVGLRRGEGVTWDEFAASVAGWAPEFAELTEAHLRGAFGQGGQLDRDRWLALLARMRDRIAAAVPRGRRVLGLLNPVSWTRVR